MKKLITIFVLSIINIAPTFAENWSRYGETNSLVIYYDKESWVKFVESKERKNLKNYYKGFIRKDDHYILTERHVKYDIPLL